MGQEAGLVQAAYCPKAGDSWDEKQGEQNRGRARELGASLGIICIRETPFHFRQLAWRYRCGSSSGME